MNKEFECYYSEKAPKVFLIISIVCFVISILDIIFLDGLTIVLFLLIFGIFFVMFIITRNNRGIAVEFVDDVLKFHGRELIEIPLEDILHFSTLRGSFAVVIQTKSNEYAIHCLIKDDRKKKCELVELLKRKGVPMK